MDHFEERPFDLHSVIEPRRRMTRRMHVVDDVDAADERDPRIDHCELAMHAAQSLPRRAPPRDVGTIEEELDAGVLQFRDESRRKLLRPVAVDQQMRAHTPLGRARERVADTLPGLVVFVDVRLEVDLALRGVARRLERREVFATAFQQSEPVAVDVLRHILSSVVVSAA